MIIALYLAITSVVIPQVGTVFGALVEPLATCAITLIGIGLVLSVVFGFRMFVGTGTTIISAVIRGIGFTVRTVIHAIGWTISGIFRIIPRTYRECLRISAEFGAGPRWSTAIAVVVTLLVIAIII